MRLDADPRIVAGPNFLYSLLEYLRKVAQAVNGHDNEVTTLKQQVADLQDRVTALENP